MGTKWIRGNDFHRIMTLMTGSNGAIRRLNDDMDALTRRMVAQLSNSRSGSKYK